MERTLISSTKKWDEIQITFLNQHTYFTKTAIQTRQKGKENNIARVQLRFEMNQYLD